MDPQDLPVFVGFWGISLSCVTPEDVEGWLESTDPGEAGVLDEEASVDSVSMSEAGDTGLSSSTDSLLLVLISNGCSFLHTSTSCWYNERKKNINIYIPILY